MSQETLVRALWRNALAALPLGMLVYFKTPHSGTTGWDFFDGYSVALCFTVFGYFVERVLLSLSGIDTGWGKLVRLVGWFAGGLWSYVIARWLWLHYGRDLNDMPGLVWGGVFLVALELLIHLGLRFAGRPNFYQSSEPQTPV